MKYERHYTQGRGDWNCPVCGGTEYSHGFLPEPKTCLRCESIKDFTDGHVDPAKLRKETLDRLWTVEEILLDAEERELFEIQVRSSALYAFYETHDTEVIADELRALRCDLMRLANGFEAFRRKLGGDKSPYSPCFHIDDDDPSYIVKNCEDNDE